VGNYPAWEYKNNSRLRETACKLYETMFGKVPEVNVVHGGLECGILLEKKKDAEEIKLCNGHR
jgi:dipeptidase D